MFSINLHEKDQYLLEQINKFFGVGKIYKQASGPIRFCVTSVKDLRIIINHFDKYPLITQKLADGGGRDPT